MTNEAIRTFCLTLPGTTEDIKWEHHLCFNVGGRMYCITTLDEFRTSFKADAGEFEELCERPGLIPAPYMARNKWVLAERGNALNTAEWERLLRHSYELVRDKLPLKVRRALAGG